MATGTSAVCTSTLNAIMQDDPYPRFLSRGRAFVYILPCAGDNLLKIGFSRDPIRRMHTLHRRFFDFFDLDHSLLIETGRVREARIIERALHAAFASDQAPAPLIASPQAGGHSEWFRGVHAEAIAMARSVSTNEGLVLHEPLSTWLHGQLEGVTALLYDWSLRMLDAIEFERHNVPPAEQTQRCDRALRDMLDLYSTLRVDLVALIPDSVLRWYTDKRRAEEKGSA